MVPWSVSLRLHQDHADVADLRKAPAQRESVETEAEANPSNSEGLVNEATVEPALGNDRAEQLFVQHLPRLYRLAKRLLGDEGDPEVVLGEVLLKIVERLGSFRSQAELTTWLDRATVNCASLHRRRRALCRVSQSGTPEEELPGADFGQECPELSVPAEYSRRLIELAISRLPDLYREPYVLSEIEGMAATKISEILGLSPAAVELRLHRARLLVLDAIAPHVRQRAPRTVSRN
jgi:RNA polymerase sigma-70 factor (ECF subfamily)